MGRKKVKLDQEVAQITKMMANTSLEDKTYASYRTQTSPFEFGDKEIQMVELISQRMKEFEVAPRWHRSRQSRHRKDIECASDDQISRRKIWQVKKTEYQLAIYTRWPQECPTKMTQQMEVSSEQEGNSEGYLDYDDYGQQSYQNEDDQGIDELDESQEEWSEQSLENYLQLSAQVRMEAQPGPLGPSETDYEGDVE